MLDSNVVKQRLLCPPLAGVALCLDKTGAVKDAEAMFRRVMELRTKTLGAKHPDTIACLWCERCQAAACPARVCSCPGSKVME